MAKVIARRADRPLGLALGALALAASVSALAAETARGQASPNGGELQVNGYTTANQSTPAVAAGPQGDFVVVWGGAGAGDSGSAGIQAKRLGADGAPLGGDLAVN